MTDREIFQELATLSERIFNAERKMNDYSGMLHTDSSSQITDLQELVIDQEYNYILNDLEV